MDFIFDFHTHIDSFEQFFYYYISGIVPVVNLRSIDEYNRIKKYEEILLKIKTKPEKMDIFLNKNNMKNDFAEEVSVFCKKIEEKYGKWGIIDIMAENSYDDVDYHKIYLSTGIHPFDADRFDNLFGSDYENLVGKSCFAGELGMDSCWSKVDMDIQEKYFLYSLALAEKLSKKVILHTKGMEGEILKKISAFDNDYIVHWYSCADYIDEYIRAGCSFTVGPAVFVDEDVRTLVKRAPMDRLLIETDGIGALSWLFKRDVNPDELRGVLESVISEIAVLKELPVSEVRKSVFENSLNMLRGCY